MSEPQRISVPLLDLKAQYQDIRSEISEAIERVLESQRFIMGGEVEALEAEIATYCGTQYAVGCASGSDALLLALMALGVGPGDQVLCPAYTFFATAGSIARLGAEPVFADIDPITYNLDPSKAREAARRCKRLKALLPVHLYGQVADLDALLELSRELGVPLVEDAAQAISARDAGGSRAGSRGNIACFSFFPSKNLGAYGDGGILTTDDSELAQRMTMLRVHGARRKYFHERVGLNSRLDALQAAILRVKLRHLDGWTKRRQENAALYDRLLTEAPQVQTPVPAPPPASHAYHQYVIRVPAERRDPLREHLSECGIGTEIYYPLGLHRQECFAELGYGPGDLPVTDAASNETLALPIFPELTREQLEHVSRSIIEFMQRD